jgi:hypothetical protein
MGNLHSQNTTFPSPNAALKVNKPNAVHPCAMLPTKILYAQQKKSFNFIN